MTTRERGPPTTGSNDICLCFCFVLVCGAFAIQVQELPDYPDHCHVPAPKLLPAPTSPTPPPPNLNTEIPRYREVDGYDRTLSDGVIYGVDATSLGVILTVYFVGCKQFSKVHVTSHDCEIMRILLCESDFLKYGYSDHRHTRRRVTSGFIQ